MFTHVPNTLNLPHFFFLKLFFRFGNLLLTSMHVFSSLYISLRSLRQQQNALHTEIDIEDIQ